MRCAKSQLGWPRCRMGWGRRGGAMLWTWRLKTCSHRNCLKEDFPGWVFPSFQLRCNSDVLLHYSCGLRREKHFTALVRKLFKWWLSTSILKFNTSEHSSWSWNEPASLRYTAMPSTSPNSFFPPSHWNGLWFPREYISGDVNVGYWCFSVSGRHLCRVLGMHRWKWPPKPLYCLTPFPHSHVLPTCPRCQTLSRVRGHNSLRQDLGH